MLYTQLMRYTAIPVKFLPSIKKGGKVLGTEETHPTKNIRRKGKVFLGYQERRRKHGRNSSVRSKELKYPRRSRSF